jgi:hypothetical protein
LAIEKKNRVKKAGNKKERRDLKGNNTMMICGENKTKIQQI